MPQNDYNQSRQKFEQFREKLYQSFNCRRDTLMDLVDAISANTTARSPVELSLSPLFQREYSALYKGIQELSCATQTDSTEAIESQKSQQRGGISRGNLGISPAQISARTLAIAELIPTPQQRPYSNLVVVTRVRSNRVFYQSPEPRAQPSKGHPQWYGDKFDLKDRATWHEPTEIAQTNFTTKKGRLLQVRIQSWSEMLMRGSHDCPMHDQLFTLMQIQVTTTEGIKIWNPMWLIMLGQRWSELTINEGYQAYLQRYDIEHLLRFGKQRLLLNASGTPDVEHEENWVSLSFLAYVQLWAARKLASTLPQRWERYLPQKTEGFLSPSLVQRDMNRIITEIGTPASAPKPRGFSSGRAGGMIQTKRTRHQVIKKGKKSKKVEPSTPIAV